MKTDVSKRSLLTALLVASLPFMAACNSSSNDSNLTRQPLKLGWQPPWANQGQIVTLLKKTELLANQKVAVEFVPFTYGGPMSEAALAGKIDIVLAGDQPVLTLLSRTSDWSVVARMTRYRSAIIVPSKSPLEGLESLKGRGIATAFGSTTHRDLVRILRDAKLTSAVKLFNLDQAEHAGLVGAGTDERWQESIDGIATYDPTIARALADGKARILHSWASPGLVAVRNSVLQSRRQEIAAFLQAYKSAFVVYAADPQRANDWYSAESKLPLNNNDYSQIAAFEPNLAARSIEDVQIKLTPEFIASIEDNAQVAREVGILNNLPEVRARFDTSIAP